MEKSDRHAEDIERENENVNRRRAIRSPFLIRTRTTDDLGVELPHRAFAAKPAVDFRIFEDRHVRVATGFLEAASPAKNSMIAEGKAENLYAQISH